MQYEIDDPGSFFGTLRSASGGEELQEIMKGYLDLVNGGRREIFLIE